MAAPPRATIAINATRPRHLDGAFGAVCGVPLGLFHAISRFLVAAIGSPARRATLVLYQNQSVPNLQTSDTALYSTFSAAREPSERPSRQPPAPNPPGRDAVGYNSTKLRFGSLGIAPQFQGIAAEDGSYDLQQIKCNDNASDSVSFTVLDAVGLDGDHYQWINWYETGDFEEDGETPILESCWVDGGFEKVVGYKVFPGDGLWVAGGVDPDPTAPENDQIFTSAGQVGVKDVSVVLRFGSLMTGNPNPVEIDLQDIICNDLCSDSVSFTILDAVGLDGDHYQWINWYETGDFEEDGETPILESCWVDGGFEKVIDFPIAPGLGMWVAGGVDPTDPEHPNPETDQIITFPGVELK